MKLAGQPRLCALTRLGLHIGTNTRYIPDTDFKRQAVIQIYKGLAEVRMKIDNAPNQSRVVQRILTTVYTRIVRIRVGRNIRQSNPTQGWWCRSFVHVHTNAMPDQT